MYASKSVIVFSCFLCVIFLNSLTLLNVSIIILWTSNKEDYESLLIQTIEQEMEHNLSQQIYISEKCWNIISAAKNATIQLIRKASLLKKSETAEKLREVILTEMMERRAPSDAALSFIKEEVSEIF